jgi:anthranilate phosphoribosyltransferase
MLGPMVNPASPAFQLVGVYNLEMARIYNYLLQQTAKHLPLFMDWTVMTKSRSPMIPK